MEPYVFISYSRADQPYVRRLVDDLHEHHLAVWVDERIDYGARWWRTIVRAVQSCTALVVVMTPDSENSEWVEREILLAQREEKPIFPLLLQGTGHALLISTQYADVTGSRMPPQDFYDRLRGVLDAAAQAVGPAAPEPLVNRLEAPDPEPFEEPSADFEPRIVRVAAGPFLMGSSMEQAAQALAQGLPQDYAYREQPQHTVHLSGYGIGRYPVTNAEYQVFVREAGYRPPRHWSKSTYPDGTGDHPVVNVSWHDAAAYCAWLGRATGRRYDLPTEAQFEKASRGTDGRLYPWGNVWEEARLNSAEGKRAGTSPVGWYSPHGDSPYGASDMAGNVWEWCADWFDESSYRTRADAAVSDPRGPARGRLRALRGGAFDYGRLVTRCAVRLGTQPDDLSGNLGFRVVCAFPTP